jgi:predicted acyl esterase
MDSYVDPVLRMLERSTSPRRAIVGNWVHEFPDDGYPGPNLDWLHETIRFLDHWLKGMENGVMDEPMLTWYRREWAPPQPFPRSWPGGWRGEATYPVAGSGELPLFLAPGDEPLRGRLVSASDAAGIAGIERLVHRATHGTRGSLSWGAGGPPNGLARDLRPDDALVPVFTSPPLEEPVDVLGMPELVLVWRSPVRVATAVVRLQDVAPDGTPIQVTAGLLNLTHRDGHEHPTPLPIGEPVTVRIPLRACGYRFGPGHRIRVSVASAAWPVAWPSPEAATHELLLGGAAGPEGARLLLPVVPAEGSAPPPVFRTQTASPASIGEGTEDPPTWTVTHDVLAGSVTVTTFEGGETVTEDETRLYASEAHRMTAWDAEPARASMRSEVRYRLVQDGHDVTADADAEMSSTATTFRHRGELRVSLDGEPFARRSWDETIPRDLC